MKKIGALWLTIMLVLLPMAVVIGCQQQSTPAPSHSLPSAPTTGEESAELQARGNGTVELITDPVHQGTYSAKLAIPEGYSSGDAARIAISLDSVTLNEITSLSYWYYVDPKTPINAEGYWMPYITFEIDTDGKAGCDTWVIGGGGGAPQSSGVWLKNTMESNWLFHVATAIPDYTSPFPLDRMGTLGEVKTAMGPDGATPLGDCIVSKVRLAIGNWGHGGPKGPVICYVDCLMCNGRLLF